MSRRTTWLAALLALLLPLLATPALAADDPITSVEPPTITGTAVVAERLRADPGTWTPDGLTFTYQWRRDGAAVTGATRRGYRLGVDDLRHRLSVTVTATDASGATETATSASTDRVRKAELTVERVPTLAGVRRYGHLLTSTAGSWSARPTVVRYQWLRDGKPIKDAVRARYRVDWRDVGHRLRVAVTVRRPGYRPAEARSWAVTGLHRVPVRRQVTYVVRTKGRIVASMAVFRRQVQQTYDDARGWRAAGISFRRVARGGAFTVVLAEARLVPTYSSACSAEWSCRVGRYVIINQTRWRHASPAWNAAKLPLRAYRHMVVNHETGHWLGHPHRGCPGRGRLAPVMMQQSKGLGGCTFNPFPLPSERWWR